MKVAKVAKQKSGSVSLKCVWGIRAKLWAEGSKLLAEGDKLRAEGNKLLADAVIECYGNIKMEWKSDTHCVLETGEEFGGVAGVNSH